MQEPVFIGAQVYRGSSYGARHPLSIPRVPVVTDLLRALGWLAPGQYRTSPRAKPAALTRFHDPGYVALLQRAEADQDLPLDLRRQSGIGSASNPIFTEVFRRPATAVGGGMLAAELVSGGGVVFNPGGGQHHALRDRAAGFCYLNEPVLTILRLLDAGLDRVAYIDIDAHHGDGVELALGGDPRVRMVSVHEANRWPRTGALQDRAGGNALNCPVPAGFNDNEFRLLLEEVILPRLQAFRPQAIFLQCGADALTEDPLSRLTLSNGCHAEAALALSQMTPRLIVSGGGGYNPWTAGRCWARVWAALAGHEVPERLPPQAQAVQSALSWTRKTRPDPALLTTLADAPRPGPIRDELRRIVAFHRPNLW